MEAYYRNYDLIVIHASVAGNNPIGVATGSGRHKAYSEPESLYL